MTSARSTPARTFQDWSHHPVRPADIDILTTSIAGAAAAVIRKRLRGVLKADAELRFVAFVRGALLVRPDQHVGWRARDAQDEASAVLATVLTRLLRS